MDTKSIAAAIRAQLEKYEDASGCGCCADDEVMSDALDEIDRLLALLEE